MRADQRRPGPTGNFPHGRPMFPGDQGGVFAKFGVLSKTPPLLGMDFGTTLTFVASPVEQAVEQAAYMREAVQSTFGHLPYDASTLPLTITADPGGKVIRTAFPQAMGILVANPHVFLAWADKLEEAAAKLTGKA